MAAVIFGLARIAIVNSERRDAEKKRGDALQASIDALRDRSEEDRKFFEVVRQLITSQNAEQKQELIDELRKFKFTTPTTTTTTTTTVKPRPTTTTTTRPSTSVTRAPPPSSTTTTTQPPRPPPPPNPPTTGCIVTPLGKICPGGT